MLALRREFPTLKVLGEVSNGNPALVSFFEGGRTQYDGIDDLVDYLYDYPLFYPLRRAFGEGRPVREVAEMLSNDRLYRDPTGLVTFVDLHDVPRFRSDRGATTAGLKLAYTFLFTTRGIPLIYYGDEIGLPGGGDPDNRRDFPGGWAGDPRNAFEAGGRTPDEEAIFTHVKKLIALRAARPGLRGRQTRTLATDEQTLVYQRGATVVALNNDTTATTVRLPLERLGPDLIGFCPVPRLEGGRTVVDLPARTGCVFPIPAAPRSGSTGPGAAARRRSP